MVSLGQMESLNFKIRVAELVTAFARVKLLEMKEIANKQFGMNIIYGDTDSIFVSDINEERGHESVDSFIAACKQNLGVEVDHQNTFVRSIIVSKKHYIGIQPDDKVIIKGMEGKKRDRPPFFNQVFSQLIEDYRNNKPDLTLNVLEAYNFKSWKTRSTNSQQSCNVVCHSDFFYRFIFEYDRCC